jgi:hypothetical protein
MDFLFNGRNGSQLLNAMKALEQHRKIEDPLIRRLLHDVESIATRVPGSFAQKLKLRAEIRGLIIRYGMPAFWITINPSDLRNPLVLIFAGVEFSGDIFAAANSAIREATATSNPIAVAEFFHHVCKAIFDSLLASNTGKVGILGDVSNHYGVVETNGRGMLHLHALVWVKGNLGFKTLRKRVLEDATFAASMISYLEKIIIPCYDVVRTKNGSGVDGHRWKRKPGKRTDASRLSLTLWQETGRAAGHSSRHPGGHHSKYLLTTERLQLNDTTTSHRKLHQSAL